MIDYNMDDYFDDKGAPFKRSPILQVFLAIVAVIPSILGGMTLGFSAITVSNLKLNVNETSLFGSVPWFGSFLGSILVGFVIDKYGRKPALVFSITPSLGWFMIACEFNIARLLLGRMLTGISTGAVHYTCSVYMAECIGTADIWIRSSLTTWGPCASTLGVLVVTSLGFILPYDIVAILAGLLSTISLVLILCFVPESPTWLYTQGRCGDAEWAQQRLGIHIAKYGIQSNNIRKSVSSYWHKLRRKDVRKPLIVGLLMNVFASASGGFVLITYMVDILDIKTIPETAKSFSVLSAASQLLASILLILLMPRWGCRALTLFSGIATSMGMFTLGVGIAFNVEFLRVGAVLFAAFSVSLGFITIPLVILGELFPPDVKALASIPLAVSVVAVALTTNLHPYLANQFGSLVYIIYGCVSSVGTAYMAFALPETIGKTLEEIWRDF